MKARLRKVLGVGQLRLKLEKVLMNPSCASRDGDAGLFYSCTRLRSDTVTPKKHHRRL